MYLDPYKPHFFPCHAGLFILAVPLHSEWYFIGALATGELRISDTLNESSTILEKVRDLDVDTAKLLRFYEKIPLIKREETMILGESLHTISNCLIKLGITSRSAKKTDQTTENDIGEINSLLSENVPLSWSRQIVQQASIYILDNFINRLSLEEVAKHVHLSPTYFSYLFSQEQKQTFSNFLIETRLEKAKELLRQHPRISVSEVSKQIGYNDSNYFSRVFKKNIGIPPSLYRTQEFNNHYKESNRRLS
jgi:AraC-like DNA-binding protein